MKNKIIIQLIIFLMCFNLFAHKNINIVKDFGIVSVVFTTGYYYEEINKSLIIGEYTEKLLSKMDYKKPITLFFKHLYVDKLFSNNSNKKIEVYKNEEHLVFEFSDSEYNIKNILQYIEYYLNNEDFDINNGLNIYNSLNKEKISNVLSEVLNNKIYRPSYVQELTRNNLGVSYYYQNNSFHIYKKMKNEDRVIISISKIFQFSTIDQVSNLIFDTRNTFYYFNNLNYSSKKYEIKTQSLFIKPHSINKISLDMIIISISYLFKLDEDVSIFFNKKQKLVQNIYKKLLQE